MNKLKTLTNGQSLFEVLLSIGIASIILVGVVSLTATSVRNSSFASNNALATKHAQEGSEWVRQYRDASWSSFSSRSSSGSGRTWCINSTPFPPPSWVPAGSCGSSVISGTIFSREMNLTNDPVDTGLIHVTITVIWHDAQGDHSVNSISSLSDWNR